jgi:excinuclease UvrABC nuclease subunit
MFLIENINIPESAGCYLYKDNKGQVIYVGKSKYLPKRVKSYFQKNHDNQKTKALVENIHSVDFVTTDSEAEALIVEENLIKLYNPKFNIKGKDDKTVRTYLAVIDEEFPRVEVIRSFEDIECHILAQFTSAIAAREVHDLLHEAFPLRSCSYSLTDDNIKAEKFKTCLEYQMGNCLAPCISNIQKWYYNKIISDIKEVFNFNSSNVLKGIEKRRNFFSEKLEFEKANVEHHRHLALQKIIKKIEPLHSEKIKKDIIKIGEHLSLRKPPFIIESFDNSHTAGQDGVACSIRFVMGRPEKSSYRKFIIKTADVGDDCGSFEEVLTRRFTRLIREKGQLPDLIVMDGGKGQLNVAIKVLSELKLDIDVIGISKDNRHRAAWLHTTDGNVYDLLKVPGKEILAKISDEVHRFTINFHKAKRDKI